MPDSHQARLTIKQTQAGEPFEFPLKMVLTCASSKDPVILDEMMTEKEVQFRLPLPGTLERIDVDPDQAILTDLKETKDLALWRAQLLQSPSVPGRLRPRDISATASSRKITSFSLVPWIRSNSGE